jgi:hypothetical protein
MSSHSPKRRGDGYASNGSPRKADQEAKLKVLIQGLNHEIPSKYNAFFPMENSGSHAMTLTKHEENFLISNDVQPASSPSKTAHQKIMTQDPGGKNFYIRLLQAQRIQNNKANHQTLMYNNSLQNFVSPLMSTNMHMQDISLAREMKTRRVGADVSTLVQSNKKKSEHLANANMNKASQQTEKNNNPHHSNYGSTGFPNRRRVIRITTDDGKEIEKVVHAPMSGSYKKYKPRQHTINENEAMKFIDRLTIHTILNRKPAEQLFSNQSLTSKQPLQRKTFGRQGSLVNSDGGVAKLGRRGSSERVLSIPQLKLGEIIKGIDFDSQGQVVNEKTPKPPKVNRPHLEFKRFRRTDSITTKQKVNVGQMMQMEKMKDAVKRFETEPCIPGRFF